MGSPFITVVINNYNYARFLDDAIQSCLNQTYSRKEVIVVDDGSSDNSREIIDGYGDKVIRIYKDNAGQGSAINAGFRQSQGDLLLFLDADDMLKPGVMDEITRHWDGKATKIHFRLDVIDNSGAIIDQNPSSNLALPEGNLQADLIRVGHYITPPSSGNVYSRQFIEATYPIPEETFRRAADSYHFIQAPLYGEVQALPHPGGIYRMHGANGFLKKRRYCTTKDLLGSIERYDRCLGLIQKFVRERGLKNTYSPKYHADMNYTRLLYLRGEDKLDFATALPLMRNIFYSAFSSKSLSAKTRLAWIVKTLFVTVAPFALIQKVYPNIRSATGATANNFPAKSTTLW